MGQRLGFDRLACLIGGAFELCKIQIPTYSPPLPGWGVVGHNIDRCITRVSVTQIIDAGLMLMVISDHATNTYARIDGKVFVRVLTHS